MRVLVADDDNDLRKLICAALERDGHQVLEARDGPETLLLLSSSIDDAGKKIDMILLDVGMPGFSGLGVLVSMRKYSPGSMPVVVVMTGMADPSIETVARRHRASGFLKKPFDDDDLRTVVADVELRSAVR